MTALRRALRRLWWHLLVAQADWHLGAHMHLIRRLDAMKEESRDEPRLFD